MTHAVTDAGRIGPNAVWRLAEALQRRGGRELAREVFEAAGLGAMLATPPAGPVDEALVARLHRQLRARLGADAAAVAREAGRATADYLLARRIPRVFQALLKALPPRWSCPLLLAAIRRHAHTFAGSGRLETRCGDVTALTLRDNPLCRGLHAEHPVCDYYAASFERLFRVLVHPATQVQEMSCEGRGDDACRFVLSWPRPDARPPAT